MTDAPEGRGHPAGWWDALRRGFVAFLLVAAIGQLLALGGWAMMDTGASFGAAAAIGWLYFGAFHHVAIRIGIESLDLPGTSTGSLAVSVGIALLAISAVAVWLVFRAGRAVADRAGGSTAARMGRGASVAAGYALPAFAVSLLVDVTTPFRLGAFAAGRLHADLSTWQALAFPLAIAGMAGGAGGLWSVLDRRTERGEWIGSAIAGGCRAFVLAAGLSLAGLFLAGVVIPDGVVALAVPTTARYVDAVFDRPAAGVVVLGHHLAFMPNEALWTLVPAMGACDALRTDGRDLVVCYSRFPRSVGLAVTTGTGGSPGPLGPIPIEVGRPPVGVYLFLLAPAVATVLGGRRAASCRAGGSAAGARVGMAAGVVFAAFVAVGSLLSMVTATVDATVDGERSSTRFVVGPEPVAGALVAMVWGLAGGAAGGATAGWFVRARPSARPPPPTPRARC